MNTMENTIDAPAGLASHRLAAHGAAPNTGMEVIAVWNDTPRMVVHRGAPKTGREAFTLGDDPACDFPVPEDLLGGDHRFGLATVDHEGTILRLPPGADARIFAADRETRRERNDTGVPVSIPLDPGARALVEIGAWSFIVTACEAPTPFTASGRKVRPNIFTGLSILLHAAFFLSISLVPPDAKGLMLGSGDETNRFSKYMIVPSEIRTERVPDMLIKKQEDLGRKNDPGKQAAGGEGAAGDRTARRTDNRYGIKGPKDNRNIRMARDMAKEMAASAGVLSYLSNQNAPTSPFGSVDPMGRDVENALGALVGNQIGPNFGYGGLGIHDSGRGGGGDGVGTLGVGNLNTIGGLPGPGGNDPFGGKTPGLGPRRPKVPARTIVHGGNVHGSIPKDVIRRHVRRQLPQIQHCYEKGLAKRPDLAGQVSIKFVISGKGTVTQSVVVSSSVGDTATEQCIARVVGRISFPQPENGGVVIATYPFTLRASQN